MAINRALIVLCFLSLALSNIAIADTKLEARVVNVLDADLLVVSIDHKAEIVMLNGVDCPARGEKGWLQIRNYIRQKVLNKEIHIETIGPQRAGRIRAKVYIGNQCLNDALADMAKPRLGAGHEKKR